MLKNVQNFSGELRYIIIEINYYNDEGINISEDEKREEQANILSEYDWIAR